MKLTKLKAGIGAIAIAAATASGAPAWANTKTVAPRSVTELIFIPGPLDGQPAIPLAMQTWNPVKQGGTGDVMPQCKAQLKIDLAVPRPYPRWGLCIADSYAPATPGTEDDRATLFGEVLEELQGN